MVELTSTSDKAFWLDIGNRAALLLAIVGNTLLRTWVVLVYWGWFAVPLGAPTLGLMHALGLIVGVRLVLFTPPQRPAEAKPWTTWQEVFTNSVFPLAVLGIGWVIKSLM